MTPQEFLDEIVRPAFEDAQADPLCHHKTIGAVAVCDMLAAHIFQQRKDAGLLATWNKRYAVDDDRFRDFLASRSQAFRLLRDVAKAQKHVHLTRCEGTRTVTKATQLKATSVGFGMGRYGEGPYGGTEQIVVEADDRSLRNVVALLCEVISFLQSELRQTPEEV